MSRSGARPGGIVDLYEGIMTTRAMRRLVNEPPVTTDELEHCLRAAVQAPSGGNAQPWHFVVVTDGGSRRAIGDLHRRAFARYRRVMADPERVDEVQQRQVRAGDFLAEHIHEVPLVVALMATWDLGGLHDEEGPMDIGGLEGSVRL